MPGSSSAKTRFALLPGHDECRHLDSKRTFATSRRDAPEALRLSLALRGRGERRMPLAPAASCALGSGRTHTSIRVPRNHPTFPHAMILTVSFELSPVTTLVCHRRPRTNVVPKPGRADITSANLTPASGRQDHTTSPYAATSLVRSLLTAHGFKEPALRSRRAQNAAASTASAPRVRDDRDTPLLWGGTPKVLELIWGKWEQKYLSENQKYDSTQLESNDGV
jgi:hypothetical protein